MRYAEVAVDAATGHGRTFSYSIPESLDLEPGQLVRVPFGSRRLQGLVFLISDQAQVSRTRNVLSTLSEQPYLDHSRLELARWVSDYYMCGLFDAAAPMLPAGVRTGERVTVHLASSPPNIENISGSQERIIKYLRSHAPVAKSHLIRVFGEGCERVLRSLERKELIVLIQNRTSPGVRPKTIKLLSLTPLGREELNSGAQLSLSRAPRQAELAKELLNLEEPLSLSEARRRMGASAVNGLRRRGWVEVTELLLSRDPLSSLEIPPANSVSLTVAQAKATAQVGHALLGNNRGTFLLEGVTGSGKTEVYLDAVEACIAAGKRAIVMVPEIALTHQTIERLAGRFPGSVAVQHSGLSLGQRYDQWWKIKDGEYGVVVGSRGAIFAPQPNLGLVVIDEEHEWTYKQTEPDPRYHAREVALQLAELTESTVVMGSASPDIVTYQQTKRGMHRHLYLPERINATFGVTRSAPLARVEIVDMRQELKEGHRHFISRSLLSSLTDALEAKEKVILFLNRRGASAQLICRNCGNGVKCGRCDVAMTLHKRTTDGSSAPDLHSVVVCHYCGNRRRVPEVCQRCKECELSLYGIGTQTVEAEIASLFPAAQVLRWDSDTARRPADVERIMTVFRKKGPAVLVGTQVVTKGLHFPDVTLVGVILADIGLGVPDLRSGERTFQLITQVAGRAGRGAQQGKVIVQTYRPDNYAIRAAASQNYRDFYQQEMEYRNEMGNPPFNCLIRLSYSHTNMAAAEREALRYGDILRHERDARGMAGLHVMGPTPGFPARLRGRYRWRLTIRGRDPRGLIDLVPLPPRWTVDVDPVGP